ncbi:hypothetical protein E4U55_006262 [Claviceps digitariae]|nr:hypothetical protein E4U55_006262 [Claviceps digitariae]
MHLRRHDFIPAGCLGVALLHTGIDTETWRSSDCRGWKTIRHRHFLDQDGENLVDGDHLPLEIQKQLINSGSLHMVIKLLISSWVDLEFCVSSDALSGTMRVYLLPDDIHRGLIDKSSFTLRRARRRLLRSLDYSEGAWAGRSTVSVGRLSPFARHDSAAGEEENESLLHVFNNIPSPCPDKNLVSDPYCREAMTAILSGGVAGLATELYGYQRRSTAFMMQKEAEPGTVLDPRLMAVKEQDGPSLWYADPVSGTVLKMPRYYDGIAGGILAEEMGSGKTVMCLALILATRDLPNRPPKACELAGAPTRPRIASLADMAASCATRNAIPWKCYFKTWGRQLGADFEQCEKALRRNSGYYIQEVPDLRRSTRRSSRQPTFTKHYLSGATLIVVPNNLVSQWKQEIVKHTTGLDICFLCRRCDEVPCVERLVELDMLVFSQSRFEWLVRHQGGVEESPLSGVHFKRCIVDEGHKLGNSKMNRKTDLVSGLDDLSFSYKWIVTGTPSHGLFGVDDMANGEEAHNPREPKSSSATAETSAEMEKKDLERLGSITALYLKAKPWAAEIPWLAESEDTHADWGTYLLLPRHKQSSRGNWTCLKKTLNSLIVRHRLSEVRDLLPPVTERVVILEGSYQDKLSQNLFAMMIIFNSVQSQRTDMDYFFHPKQRKSLLQIVHNLKQSSFFGGSFFTSTDIAKAVETACEFLQQAQVPISGQDRTLLLQAIDFGRLAIDDQLRNLSIRFHEMPILVRGLCLGAAGRAWSLDGGSGDPLCTSASLMLSLQRVLCKASSAHDDDAASLNSLLNGGLIKRGSLEKDKMILAARLQEDCSGRAAGTASRRAGPEDKDKIKGGQKGRKPIVLAGNTRLGQDIPHPTRRPPAAAIHPADTLPATSLPACLAQANLMSTVSAKLSYLVDSVLRYQAKEKMIIFYDNENVAWYVASVLDMLHVQHLIYAKSLTNERKAQYVDAFHDNQVFRVLLMDLSQAAFGLDMRQGSRIYFINPVLNPQIEAQAIGRVRRLSQHQPVSVETLVLRDSIDEVILERKQHMTQAEHRRVRSLLDVRSIYNWIKGSRIVRMPCVDGGGGLASHMVDLTVPAPMFAGGGGCGREDHLGEGFGAPIPGSEVKTAQSGETASAREEPRSGIPRKRTRSGVVLPDDAGTQRTKMQSQSGREGPAGRGKRLRFV